MAQHYSVNLVTDDYPDGYPVTNRDITDVATAFLGMNLFPEVECHLIHEIDRDISPAGFKCCLNWFQLKLLTFMNGLG